MEKLREEAPKAFAIAAGLLELAIAERLVERLGKAVASRITIDAGTVLEGSPRLDAQVLAALEDAKLKPKAYQAAKDAAAELGASAGLVLSGEPLGAQPFLRDIFARDADERLAAACGLDPAIYKKIGQPLETLRGAELGALVEQGVLDRTSALALGLTLTVHALLDRDPLRTAHVLAALRARKIASPHALGTLSLKDWTALLGDTKQAARALAEVERVQPSACLQARLSARASALLASPALAEALTEVDKQSSWLNDEGGGEPLRALRRLVRAHPGLGLDAIVQSDASHAAKAVALGERLALFARVRAALPELRSVSLTRPPTEWSFVEWGHASPDEQRAVAEALRAHQRVLAITSDPGQAEALLTAGLGSAAAIGPTPVPLLAERTGLPIELARPLAEAARRTMGRAGQQALRLRELLGDRLAPRLRFDPAVIGESFRDLPDMAALFGASCRCEPCRSVLSPGAYFADLMCVIESDVIARFFTPATDRSPGHPHALHPRTRRPDLWELPLSCAHTNDEVPTLAIVLEVLERYARELHGASDVYTDVLARGARSLRQPFERAQAEIDAALSKLGSTRLALAEAVGGARDRAALAMSATHAALVFGPAPPAREIEARLGVSLGLPVPMAALMRATHLDRDAVAQVLEARFVRGTDAPSIVRVDEGRAEEVRGLTAGLLDRLHRFERLRAHTGWAARELDAVLSTTGLSVESIGAIRRTQLRFGIDPLEACALCVALPDALVATLFANAQSNRLFVHPAHGGADAATAGVLRAGCRTSEDELVLWLDRLARERGGRAEDGVALNRHTLGWLYRHARLASLLGVRSRELKGLLDLGAGSVSGPASLDALLTLFDASRALGVTLDELALLLGARTDSEEASALAREVLASIERRRLLDVGASVLALRFDVDEATSDVFLRQSGAFEPLGEGTYRWRAGVALDALEVPGALATTLGLNPAEAREAVREALAPFHPAAALPAALAQALGWPLDAAEAWLAGAHASALLTEPALTARLRGLPALRVALRGVHASNIAELLRHRERLGLTRLDPRALEALPALRGLASTEEAPVRLFALEGVPVLAPFLGARPGELDRFGAGLAALAGAVRALELARALGVTVPTLRALDEAPERAASELLASLSVRDVAAHADTQDTLREARRDALVDHLLHEDLARLDVLFEHEDDLVAYFLIDVMAGGCARTTRLASAISSAQLYLQRCLLRLERDRLATSSPRHVDVRLEPELEAEWRAWRRSYRLWEANRKVFLFPESYLHPSIRDDATPLFRAFEESLQQRPVDEQSVLEAYAAYLEGFRELASLEIVAAYHEPTRGQGVLHLVGATRNEPLALYYRRVTGLESIAGADSASSRSLGFEPWTPLELTAPVRSLSLLVHDGRPHIFWLELATRPRTTVDGGSMRFEGYTHEARLRVTYPTMNGEWVAPQSIPLDVGPFRDADGVIREPGFGEASPATDGAVRLFDGTESSSPRERHSLRGPRWVAVYPQSSEGRIFVGGFDYRLRAWLDLRHRALREGARPPMPPHSHLFIRDGNGLRRRDPPQPTVLSPLELAMVALDPDRDVHLAGLRYGVKSPLELVLSTPSALRLSLEPEVAILPIAGTLGELVLQAHLDPCSS